MCVCKFCICISIILTSLFLSLMSKKIDTRVANFLGFLQWYYTYIQKHWSIYPNSVQGPHSPTSTFLWSMWNLFLLAFFLNRPPQKAHKKSKSYGFFSTKQTTYIRNFQLGIIESIIVTFMKQYRTSRLFVEKGP